MQKTHDFELYTYGVADSERNYKWILYSTGREIPAEKVYNQFPKEYVNI